MSRKLRLLCVEDDQNDAELIVREISRGGKEVEYLRVDTAVAMRNALEQQVFDAVISDYTMPRFTALGALEVLHQSGCDLPFIIMSGTISEELAVVALKAGAHDFIPKGKVHRLLPALDRELREASSREERRRAEAELRRTTSTINALFDASPLPIIVLDHEGKIMNWNAAAHHVFGWSEEEVVGRPAPFTLQDGGGPARRFERVWKGELISSEEISRKNKDGRPLRLLVSAAPIRDEHGEISAAMGIFVDVTEQRELEEQFRQAQKMEAVGRLAGGIAHDFNNVLTAIQGYATLLMSDFPETDQRRDDAAEIIKAADRAASFTRQLLAFSRKQVVQPDVHDINLVVGDLANMLRRIIGDHIDFRIRIHREPLTTLIDKGQLEQIVVNLVVNARDAVNEAGSVTLATHLAEVSEDEAALHEVAGGRYAIIEVTDNGTGIPAEVLEHIFEPFYTTKETGKGTGLGLSTVYGIVRQSGGFIRVESEPGAGTTFRIMLPVVSSTGQIDASTPAPQKMESVGARVLVVEDELPIRNIISRILDRAGFVGHVVSRPEDAIAVLESDEPLDILLTDVMLPGLNGTELVRQALQLRPDLRVVFMSGYAAEQTSIDRSYSFIEKPFTPKELVDVLKETLTRA